MSMLIFIILKSNLFTTIWLKSPYVRASINVCKAIQLKTVQKQHTEFNLSYPSEYIPCREEPSPNPSLLKLAGYNKDYPKYNIKELRCLIEHPGVHRLIIPIFKRTCTRILVAAELRQRYLLQTTRVCDNFVQQSWPSSLKLGGSAVTENKNTEKEDYEQR